MFNFIKQLLCKHEYSFVSRWNCTFITAKNNTLSVPITFLECPKCRKRIAVKNSDCFYTKTVIEMVKLWIKHEINIKGTTICYRKNTNEEELYKYDEDN